MRSAQNRRNMEWTKQKQHVPKSKLTHNQVRFLTPHISHGGRHGTIYSYHLPNTHLPSLGTPAHHHCNCTFLHSPWTNNVYTTRVMKHLFFKLIWIESHWLRLGWFEDPFVDHTTHMWRWVEAKLIWFFWWCYYYSTTRLVTAVNNSTT